VDRQSEERLGWLLASGKDPEKANSYAMGVVSNRTCGMDQFYRFVWDGEGACTTRQDDG
jgi:hypothetical protein